MANNVVKVHGRWVVVWPTMGDMMPKGWMEKPWQHYHGNSSTFYVTE